MPWWAILCCGVFGVLAVAGGCALALSVLRLMRASGRLQRTLEPALAELERASQELERRNVRAAEGRHRLHASQTRARASYDRVLLLYRALDEVRTGLRLLRLARGLR